MIRSEAEYEAARQRLGAVVRDVELRQHAARGAADQHGAVVHGVSLHTGLRQRRDRIQRLAKQELDEVEPVRRQVD